MTTVMYRFAENTYIPFGHYACSQPCAEIIYDRVQEMSQKSEIEMEKQYKADLAAANSSLSSKTSDEFTRSHLKGNKHKRRSQLRNCSIM